MDCIQEYGPGEVYTCVWFQRSLNLKLTSGCIHPTAIFVFNTSIFHMNGPDMEMFTLSPIPVQALWLKDGHHPSHAFVISRAYGGFIMVLNQLSPPGSRDNVELESGRWVLKNGKIELFQAVCLIIRLTHLDKGAIDSFLHRAQP
jgi:hypothetical protein